MLRMQRRTVAVLLCLAQAALSLPGWSAVYVCQVTGEQHASCCCAQVDDCSEPAPVTDCGCCDITIQPATSVSGLIPSRTTSLDFPSSKFFAGSRAEASFVLRAAPSTLVIAALIDPPPRAGPSLYIRYSSFLC